MYFQMSLLILFFSCNSVEKRGKRMEKICWHLYDRLEDERTKEKVYFLAKYTEVWRPVFTAAGFFNITHTSLPDIFSEIVAYAVMLIQFHIIMEQSTTVTKN